MLDILDDMLTEMGIAHARLDGAMDNELRPAMLADFNREGSATNVFLLSTRAGGVGINLQSADTVILAESDWNPQADLQAVSRVQRIGQKKTVHVMRLVTHRQIDEIIIQRAREKKRIEAVAVGAGKFSSGTEGVQDVHQQDIAKLLDDLDAAAPVFSEVVEIDSDDAARKALESAATTPATTLSVANSVVPTTDTANMPTGEESAKGKSAEDGSKSLEPCKEMLDYAAEWDKLLLRTGETSLPSSGAHPVLPLAGPADVPEWLKASGADVNYIPAGLKAIGPLDAARAVEAAKGESEFLAGQSKRDRGSRKSRFVISLAELDDSESNSSSESDENKVMRRSERRKQDARRNRKRKVAQVNLVSSDDDVYMPSDGNIDVDDDDDEEDYGIVTEEVVVGRKLSGDRAGHRANLKGKPKKLSQLPPSGAPKQVLSALNAQLDRLQPTAEPIQTKPLLQALQGIAAAQTDPAPEEKMVPPPASANAARENGIPLRSPHQALGEFVSGANSAARSGSASKTAVLDLTVDSQSTSQPMFLANASATLERGMTNHSDGNRYLTDTMELELAFRKELRARRLRKSLPADSRILASRDGQSRSSLGALPVRVDPSLHSVKRRRRS